MTDKKELDTLHELKQKLAQVDRTFKWMALALVAAYTILFALLWFVLKLPPFSAAGIATFVFQAGLIYYGLGFVARHFVRGDYKSDLSIELGVKASKNQDKIAETLDELSKSIKRDRDIVGPGAKVSKEELVSKLRKKL